MLSGIEGTWGTYKGLSTTLLVAAMESGQNGPVCHIISFILIFQCVFEFICIQQRDILLSLTCPSVHISMNVQHDLEMWFLRVPLLYLAV